MTSTTVCQERLRTAGCKLTSMFSVHEVSLLTLSHRSLEETSHCDDIYLINQPRGQYWEDISPRSKLDEFISWTRQGAYILQEMS